MLRFTVVFFFYERRLPRLEDDGSVHRLLEQQKRSKTRLHNGPHHREGKHRLSLPACPQKSHHLDLLWKTEKALKNNDSLFPVAVSPEPAVGSRHLDVFVSTGCGANRLQRRPPPEERPPESLALLATPPCAAAFRGGDGARGGSVAGTCGCLHLPRVGGRRGCSLAPGWLLRVPSVDQ